MPETLTTIPRIPDCTTVFVAGPVASGKTWLIGKLVDRMERALIFDAGADYLDANYTHIWSNPKNLAETLQKNPYYYRIAYHLNPEFREDEFSWCYRSIWTLDKPRWFVIEEAHEICPINGVLRDAETVLRYSRHVLLGVIASSQRIADVDKLLTGGARVIILFHTSEARDIEATRLRWGKEVAEALINLRPCIYNDATKEVEQHPECIIIIKGQGFRVVSLGTKVKKFSKGDDIWSEQEVEAAEMQEAQSLEQNSGNPEPSSRESTSELSQPS
jgi:hypothetical protein